MNSSLSCMVAIINPLLNWPITFNCLKSSLENIFCSATSSIWMLLFVSSHESFCKNTPAVSPYSFLLAKYFLMDSRVMSMYSVRVDFLLSLRELILVTTLSCSKLVDGTPSTCMATMSLKAKASSSLSSLTFSSYRDCPTSNVRRP